MRRARWNYRRGIGMAEALISLAISAVLLTAVAISFQASAGAANENDEFSRATQSGRVAMVRLLAQIRCGSVDQPTSSNTLHLITAGTPPDGGQDLTYQWDSSTKVLKMITNDDVTDPDYTMAENVSSVSFSAQMGKDSNNADCVMRIAVQIAVKIGDNEVLLSGAASPRRNLSY